MYNKKYNNYFRLHYFMLKIFGINISDNNPNLLYTIYSVVIVMLLFYIYTIVEAIDLIENWENLKNFMLTLSYLLIHIMGVCKITLTLFYKEKIHNYCQSLEVGNFLPNMCRGGQKEFEIVKNAIQIYNRQACFFYVIVLSIVTESTLHAFLDPGHDEISFDSLNNITNIKHIRLTPFSIWLPFKPVKTPLYEIASLYQIACGLFFGFVTGAIDAIICGMYLHIKAQFLILKNVLDNYLKIAANLMENVDIDVSIYQNSEQLSNGIHIVEKIPPILQKYVDIVVKGCVEHHQDIIDLSEGVEDTFCNLMLVQFLGSLLLICFQLFQLSLLEIRSLRFLGMALYLIMMLFQNLIFCWHSNEIQLVSESLKSTIFESDWLVCDLKTQKSFVLMMLRAQRPLKMTVGKFAFLSLETFMTIIRGSGSYFMVLRKVNSQF